MQFDITKNLTSALRGMIKASEGKKLVISDLAGIEGRVLPWLCKYQLKLDMIESGANMYLVAAAAIYKREYAAYLTAEGKVNKAHPEYLPGKVGELALGYQGAAGALTLMGEAYGIKFEEEQKDTIVEGWRAANKPIVDFWRDTEKTAKLAIDNKAQVYDCGRVDWVLDDDFLFAVLPSGREIGYYKPRIISGQIQFRGQNTYTRKWEIVDTYGGKLVENITQATARDILQAGLRQVEAAGYTPLFTVHDEIVCETPDTDEFTHEKLSELLATQPSWATGLPLAAEGYESQRYKK